MQEHSVKALSSPAASSLQRRLPLSSLPSVALEGMQAAHWEGLKFLTRFIAECRNIAQRGAHAGTEDAANKLQERCARSGDHKRRKP